jgi:hypothetical protein
LLGAAVDDEEVSKYPQDILDDLTNWGTLKSDYGVAIEEEVVKFYNLFNPEYYDSSITKEQLEIQKDITRWS